MEEDIRILQLMPAQDWVAVFEDDGEELYLPLVCFALVEGQDGDKLWTDVRPMTIDDKLVVFCDEIDNFLRIDRIESIPDADADADTDTE